MTAREVSWTPTATTSLSHLPEKVGTAVVAFVYGALALEPGWVDKPLRTSQLWLRVVLLRSAKTVAEVDTVVRARKSCSFCSVREGMQ